MSVRKNLNRTLTLFGLSFLMLIATPYMEEEIDRALEFLMLSDDMVYSKSNIPVYVDSLTGKLDAFYERLQKEVLREFRTAAVSRRAIDMYYTRLNNYVHELSGELHLFIQRCTGNMEAAGALYIRYSPPFISMSEEVLREWKTVFAELPQGYYWVD